MAAPAFTISVYDERGKQLSFAHVATPQEAILWMEREVFPIYPRQRLKARFEEAQSHCGFWLFIGGPKNSPEASPDCMVDEFVKNRG